MSTPTATTDKGTGQHAGTQPQHLLSRRQTRTVERLPPGHVFVGILGRTPIVRRPDGYLSPMLSGRPLETAGVQAAESYLRVRG
jgi:hypothetical protein